MVTKDTSKLGVFKCPALGQGMRLAAWAKKPERESHFQWVVNSLRGGHQLCGPGLWILAPGIMGCGCHEPQLALKRAPSPWVGKVPFANGRPVGWIQQPLPESAKSLSLLPPHGVNPQTSGNESTHNRCQEGKSILSLAGGACLPGGQEASL